MRRCGAAVLFVATLSACERNASPPASNGALAGGRPTVASPGFESPTAAGAPDLRPGADGLQRSGARFCAALPTGSFKNVEGMAVGTAGGHLTVTLANDRCSATYLDSRTYACAAAYELKCQCDESRRRLVVSQTKCESLCGIDGKLVKTACDEGMTVRGIASLNATDAGVALTFSYDERLRDLPRSPNRPPWRARYRLERVP